MRCVVTAGPTFEPIDAVRRITNFSTGRLGTELASFLQSAGDEVLLLRGQMSTYQREPYGVKVKTFGTTQELMDELRSCAVFRPDVVFHAAAVSDYRVFEIVIPGRNDRLKPGGGKIPTALDEIILRLVPTPKIISYLRQWFSDSVIVGWKYEVDGNPCSAIAAGIRQVCKTRSDFCVVNGPAYGRGFAVVGQSQVLFEVCDMFELFGRLRALVAETIQQRGLTNRGR